MGQFQPDTLLTRISHQLSTAAADPGMSTALRSVGRLVSMPVCTASLRNLVRKAGYIRLPSRVSLSVDRGNAQY
jgi:hypothetical protein